MKNNGGFYFVSVLVASLIALTSCNNPFESWLKLDSAPKQEGFTLSFNTVVSKDDKSNPSRSIRPVALLEQIKYVSADFLVGQTSMEKFENLPVVEGSVSFYDIPDGSYFLSIIAYDAENIEIARGVQNVTVAQQSTIPFTLSRTRTATGTGSLAVTLTVSNLPVLPSEINYELMPVEANPRPISLSNVEVNPSVAGAYEIQITELELLSKDYRISASYTYAGIDYQLIPDPVVKIYDSQPSLANFTVDALLPNALPVVLFSDFVDLDGKRVFMTLSDSSNEDILGIGIGAIGSYSPGAVEITPMQPSGGAAYQIIAGQGYIVNAFVDVENTYSDIIDTTGFYTNINEIVPQKGDLTTSSPYDSVLISRIASTALGAIRIFASDMSYSDTEVYFVSASGNGDNDGSRISKSLDFLSALEKTAPTPTSPDNYVIYISENVTYPTPVDSAPLIQKAVKIKSLGSTQHIISLSGIDGGVPFQINSGGILSLENLVIDGKNIGRWTSGFDVYGGGTLNLQYTTIKNFNNNNDSGGGAVCLYGEELSLATLNLGSGSKIINNTTSEYGAGAGVYIGEYATMIIDSQDSLAQINGNVASTGNGGGIYIEAGGKLQIDSSNYEITGNTANEGGGVFCSEESNITGSNADSLTGNCINNTATIPNGTHNVYVYVGGTGT